MHGYSFIGIIIIALGSGILFFGSQYLFGLEEIEEIESTPKPQLWLHDRFKDNFFEIGWLDQVEVEMKTKAPYFMVNEDIIFHIMVSVKEPVERVRANIFYAEDRNLFEDPPTEHLKYPENGLPGFDSRGRILGIDLEPNSDDCEICGYAVWTEPRYFEKPGKYFIHVGALQENIPVNWTSTRTVVDLKSEETVSQLQFNQNVTKRLENIDVGFLQSEFWTKGFGLLGIGFAIVGIGITLVITGQTKESTRTNQQKEKEYRNLQNQKNDLRFKLNKVNSNLDSMNYLGLDQDQEEMKSNLEKDAENIQKNIDELDKKIKNL